MADTVDNLPDIVAVIDDHLERRRLSETARQAAKGNTHRARQADLCRWGLLIAETKGARTGPAPARFDPHDCFQDVTVNDFANLDTLVSALAAAKRTGPDRRPRYSPATVQRMLSTLRTFGAWLEKRGLIDHDITHDEELKVAKEGGRQIKAIGDDAAAQLINAAQHPPGVTRSRWATRDIAVIHVLAGCGLRASEICDAQIDDIITTSERPLIHLIGKGDKDRDVPIGSQTWAALGAYLQERQQRAGQTVNATNPAGGNADAANTSNVLAVTANSPLFVRNDGRPFNPSFLDRLIRNLAAQAGVSLKPGAAAHSFRHQYASTMARRNVPLPLMQQALGHASADTTAIYTKATRTQLIAALDDADML